MLDSITASGLTIPTLLITSSAAILAGLIIAFVHTRTVTSYTKQFAIALVVLPILVKGVVIMVNGNLGIGIAILGAFSLVRFRSIPGSAREIVSVFFAMSIGLATGTGYIGYALIATLLIGTVLIALTRLRIFEPTTNDQLLRISIPEDLNHDEALAEVFDKYSVAHTLQRMKTKNMGSLFELTYAVEVPADIDRKAFLNDLRIRNNNLAIVLSEAEQKGGL